MSSSRDDSRPEAIGEKVLTTAVASARDTWGERLVAAYALGSLAHGGFSIHVSDVDLGLILGDPLEDQDTEEMANLSAAIKASGAPLATRLSVFWGSIATLSGQASGGRFPPLDRLDLIRYGRLLEGRDVRDQLPSPSVRDLVVVGAEFALRVLSKPDVTAKLKNPEALAASDLITLTKHVLFPVRFFIYGGHRRGWNERLGGRGWSTEVTNDVEDLITEMDKSGADMVTVVSVAAKPEQQAIKNIRQVIEPDGKIYIIGAILDNTRLTPPLYWKPDPIGGALRTP